MSASTKSTYTGLER